VGLRPTAAPIDLHTPRVNHEAFDTACLEETCEPKGIVARLVAHDDRWLLPAYLRPTITGREELRHQALAVTTFDRIDARPLSIGKLDTQQPRILTQLNRAVKPIRRRCGSIHAIHSDISLKSNNDF